MLHEHRVKFPFIYLFCPWSFIDPIGVEIVGQLSVFGGFISKLLNAIMHSKFMLAPDDIIDEASCNARVDEVGYDDPLNGV